MMNVYYIKEDNAAVQDFYAHLIGKGLEYAGFPELKVISYSEIGSIDKKSIIISISHYTTFKLWIRGFNNIIYWIQGSSPDESFMRNHSYFRKFIISCIEYIAISKSKFIFMVSQGMLNHFKKKYHKDYSFKTYIMPCYNSVINKELFMTPMKYDNNTFCYVGGLSVWQCFPETVAMYKQLENQIPNTKFMVFTGDLDKAESILKSYDVKNYEIKYVKPDQLVNELSYCKYGFIVRAKSPVNYVATPTKLSNYMSAGLIPIVSNTVSFFEEILGKSKYAVVLDGNDDIKKVIDMANKTISSEDVFYEYNNIFNKFYCNETHIINIGNRLKKVLL